MESTNNFDLFVEKIWNNFMTVVSFVEPKIATVHMKSNSYRDLRGLCRVFVDL